MVAKRHKITNVPLFKKLWDIIFFFGDNNFLSHFSGHFEGASTFLTPKLSLARGQKSLGPLKMSLEMTQKVIVPQKKNMSRSFLNSGTLIVISSLCTCSPSNLDTGQAGVLGRLPLCLSS
jgi:hypothetical protein